jgi:hypothetical protein
MHPPRLRQAPGSSAAHTNADVEGPRSCAKTRYSNTTGTSTTSTLCRSKAN